MWQLYGVAAMVLLAAMLVVIKKISITGVSAGVLLLYVFLGGFLFNTAHLVATRQSFRIGPWALAMVAGAALLSFLGNLFYIKAIALAPNPGYPTAIEGAKAVLVLLAACLLMGAEFSVVKAVGVALCVAGVALIVL